MGEHAIPQTIGRYVIHDKFASGGMASVHFGRLQGAAGFSRTVAIKRLHPHLAEDPEFLPAIIDEARLAARIHHPNVVSTLDVVAAKAELLLVMEYVRGESLSRLLRAEAARGRRTPLPVASAIVVGALYGLHAAHEATDDRDRPLGVVHRDVSPQNILVGIDGVARLIDFGIAKAAGRLHTTRDGVIKGKLSYMAPEQLAAEPITRRVDVYAMAIVLWEILTGERLFRGDADAALLGQVLVGAKTPPSVHAPNLPAELDALVMTGLAVEPARRFASAREMAEALSSVVPPAFPAEVGEWVQDLAREGLARRAAILAEIESASGMASEPPPASAGREAEGPLTSSARAETRAEDAPTVSSQPSSPSAEPPRAGISAGLRSRRAAVAGVILATVLLFVGAAMVAWRRGPTTSVRDAGEAPSGPVFLTGPPPPSSAAMATPVTTPRDADAPPSHASSPPRASSSPAASPAFHPAGPRARPRPAPSHSGALLFAQPD